MDRRDEYPGITELRRAFSDARIKVLGEELPSDGIGRLSEKAVHKMLKLTLEPRVENHEIKLLGSIADIKNEDGVFEIQTASPFILRSKLEKLSKAEKVTLVLPLINKKSIRWIDPETGEISEPRKSPKHENVYSALSSLAPLSQLICSERLRVKLMLLSVDEYKRLDGWDKTKKKGSRRIDRIPSDIIDVIDLNCREDYLKYLPIPQGEEFLAKDFAALIALPSRRSYYVIKLFEALGFVSQVGKRGRAFVYKRN